MIIFCQETNSILSLRINGERLIRNLGEGESCQTLCPCCGKPAISVVRLFGATIIKVLGKHIQGDGDDVAVSA